MTTKFGQHVTRYLEDPQQLNQFTQRNFGQDAKSFETQLAALADVRAGRMPEGKIFSQIAAQAKQAYGWTEKQTKQSLREIIELPMPQQRVGAFLTAGGYQTTSEILNTAYKLAGDYERTRTEVGLEMGMAQRQKERDNDPFRPKTPEYKAGEAEKRDANNLRSALEFFSGTQKPQSFEEKQAAVMKARLQVADRLEAHAMNPNPSLREEVASNLELHQVNEMSKEFGLGDPVSAAASWQEHDRGHLDEGFDPIESSGVRDD